MTNRYTDVAIGAAGTLATFGLNQVNALLAACAGVLTIALLAFRLRRAWKFRNYPPRNWD